MIFSIFVNLSKFKKNGPNPPSNFHLPAGPWVEHYPWTCRAVGCALSLAISKVPDARRQGVTKEA
jgi:hypothetical protein